MDNIVGFVSRNLVIKTNFVKFQDGQIFLKFWGKKEPKLVGDTWHDACMPCRFVQFVKTDQWRKREKRERKGREGKERGNGRSVA